MEGMYRERFRPQYHFTAPLGWLNDPNGLIYDHGEYHLFYQYNPHSTRWASPHWGHAVSRDMVRWRDLPIALYPDKLGSIFSGTIVADKEDTSGLFGKGGGLAALFTHDLHGQECQSLAISSDRGRTWKKYPGNPVLRGGEGPEWKDFRDPKVFRFGGKWIMLLGGGRYRFYESEDLIHWSFVRDMAIFEEFPDLFPLQGKWVLNINGYGCYVGDFSENGFLPCQPLQAVESANSWQACYTFAGMPAERIVWMAWMRDSAKAPTEPWRCNMSVPREVKLREEDGGYWIVQYPITELDTLREALYHTRDISAGEEAAGGVRGQCLDIDLDVTLRGEEDLRIRCFEKGDGYLEIGYRPRERLFYVDTRNATAPDLRQYCTMFPSYMSVNGTQIKILSKLFTGYYRAGDSMRIRILIDVSTAEIFVDGGMLAFTVNVYPEADADGFSIRGKGHAIRSLDVYRMGTIHTER